MGAYGDWVVDIEFYFAEDEFFVGHLSSSWALINAFLTVFRIQGSHQSTAKFKLRLNEM
jgi:hypothetical protein